MIFRHDLQQGCWNFVLNISMEGKMTKQTFHSVMAQSKNFGSKLNSSTAFRRYYNGMLYTFYVASYLVY